MKTISLWAMMLSSVFFVVVVCIDQQRWDWLGCYVGLAVIWMLIGCLWMHRKELKHDFKIMSNCESPFQCKWFGSFLVMAFIFIAVIALIIWGVWSLIAWLITLF